MNRLLINSLDALIPLAIGLLLLLFPQWFTKVDLTSEVSQSLAKRMKAIGWLLLVVGVLILISNIGSTMFRK